MLWVTSGANQTMDRKNNRTKKSTQEYSLFAMTSVDARTELKTLDHDTLTSEIRIQGKINSIIVMTDNNNVAVPI